MYVVAYLAITGDGLGMQPYICYDYTKRNAYTTQVWGFKASYKGIFYAYTLAYHVHTRTEVSFKD